MTLPNWDRIKEVFNAVLGVPQADRPALLDLLCSGDAELRREVESLLEARTLSVVRTGGAANAIADMTTASLPDPYAANRVGMTIHRYKLLQIIGEGGFGTVYLAEQAEPVRRRVALKVIKPGMDSRAIVARFEAERQALAMMDHPHIARVLDGGVTPLTESGGGLPYFVMEYVVGDPVTAFADAHTLSITGRLDLFQQVCSAVQHAHTKGIIHRDLKPANVIVSMVDGRAFAKVIDFGIAKATGAAGGRLTDKTFFTEHRQLIGTPEYMSPEQAEGSLDIDTRTDVYALGVLLYELLTGSTPIESARLRSAAFGEMQRIIREEEPLAPSMRISRSLERLASTAAMRKVDPTKLSAMVKGELDWIVLKALEKDRSRRYETPSALADDVRRHLAGEPVVAAPPSRAYRLRKFVRRHKHSVVAGAALGVALALGLFGTSIGLLEARSQRRALLSETARAVTNENIANMKTAELDSERLKAIAAAETAAKARSHAERLAYVANIGAASAAIRDGDWSRAQARLDACVPSLRGWEWRYLSAEADTTIMRIKPDYSEIKALSQDGRKLLVQRGEWLDIRSPETGGPRNASVKVDFGNWSTASMSADGSLVAGLVYERTESGAARTFLELRRGSDLSVLWRVEQSEDPFDGSDMLAFAPDGSACFCVHADSTIRRWDVRTQNSSVCIRLPVAGQTGLDALTLGMRISADGKHILTWHEDRALRVWDVTSGSLERTIRLERKIEAAAISADGSRVAAIADGLCIWNGDNPNPVYVDRDFDARGLAFDPAGARVAGCGWSGEVAVVNLADGSSRILEASIEADRIQWSADASRIAVATDSAAVAFAADTGARTDVVGFLGNSARGDALAASPSGRLLVLGDYPSLVVDTTNWSVRQVLQYGPEQYGSRAFSPDERFLACSWQQYIYVYELSTGRTLFHTDIDSQHPSLPSMTSRAWDSSSSRLALVYGGVAEVVDIAHDMLESPIGSRDTPVSVTWAGFVPGADKIVTAGRDGKIRVWRAENYAYDQLLHTLDCGEGEIQDVDIASDGSALLAQRAGEVWVWDLSTGSRRCVIKAEGFHARFTADARGVLCDDGNSLRLLDSNTGQNKAFGEGGVEVVQVIPGTSRLVADSPEGLRLLDETLQTVSRLAPAISWSETALIRGGTQLVAWSEDDSLLCFDLSFSEPRAHDLPLSASPLLPSAGPGQFLWWVFVKEKSTELRLTASGLHPVERSLGDLPLACVRVRADGWRGRTAVPSEDVRIVDQSGSTLCTLPIKSERVKWSEFDSAGDSILLVDSSSEISVWSIPSGEREFIARSNNACAAISHDGALVAYTTIAANAQFVAVQDLKTNAVRTRFECKDAVRAMSFSHGSDRLAVCCDRSTRIHSTRTGELLARTDSDTGAVEWSPDDSRIVGGSPARTIVWDSGSGEELLLVPNSYAFRAASFTADNDSLVGAGFGQLRTLDGVPYRIRKAERRANARGEDGGAIVRAWRDAVLAGTEKEFSVDAR